MEEMSICDNLGEHLIGNVYVRFRNDTDADKAVADLNNRWFNGSRAPVFVMAYTPPLCYVVLRCAVLYYILDTRSTGMALVAELSPVTDFREAHCRYVCS